MEKVNKHFADDGVIPLGEMAQIIIEESDLDKASALGLRVTTFNAALRRSRLERGLTQEALAKKTGLGRGIIEYLETLRQNAKPEQAQKIAEVLGEDVETIFPEYLQFFLRGKFLRGKKEPAEAIVEIPMSSIGQALLKRAEADYLLSPASDPEEEAMQTALTEKIEDVLYSLTPRERQVIQLRFGISDDKPRTLEEVGKEFGVTRERIRQIEARAMQKLRDSSRARQLKDFVEAPTGTERSPQALINGAVNCLCRNDWQKASENLAEIDGEYHKDTIIGRLVDSLLRCEGWAKWDENAMKKFINKYEMENMMWAWGGYDEDKILEIMQILKEVERLRTEIQKKTS